MLYLLANKEFSDRAWCNSLLAVSNMQKVIVPTTQDAIIMQYGNAFM